MLKVQMAGTVHLHQTQDNQKCGNCLGNNGRQRNTCHTHVKDDDKEQVEDDVDHARQGQKVERALGVTDGTQDGSAEVVHHKSGHSYKVDAHIQNRQVDDIFRGAHHFQHRTSQQDADKNQDDAAPDGGQYRGVYRAVDAVIVLGAVIARNNDIGSDRNADKKIDDQVDQRTG